MFSSIILKFLLSLKYFQICVFLLLLSFLIQTSSFFFLFSSVFFLIFTSFFFLYFLFLFSKNKKQKQNRKKIENLRCTHTFFLAFLSILLDFSNSFLPFSRLFFLFSVSGFQDNCSRKQKLAILIFSSSYSSFFLLLLFRTFFSFRAHNLSFSFSLSLSFYLTAFSHLDLVNLSPTLHECFFFYFFFPLPPSPPILFSL